MSAEVALVVFVSVEVAGVLVAIHWWRESRLPIPRRPHPSYVFRLVRREDRAAYSRMMRRTLAVATRDLSRSFRHLGMVIGRAVLPAIEDFITEANRILGRERTS